MKYFDLSGPQTLDAPSNFASSFSRRMTNGPDIEASDPAAGFSPHTFHRQLLRYLLRLSRSKWHPATPEIRKRYRSFVDFGKNIWSSL